VSIHGYCVTHGCPITPINVRVKSNVQRRVNARALKSCARGQCELVFTEAIDLRVHSGAGQCLESTVVIADGSSSGQDDLQEEVSTDRH
jgi:hypothetical protein